jgi:hypothetical protein
MYKAAAEKTWYLAPSLTLKQKIPNAYSSIICYTSRYLNEVVLKSQSDYLSVFYHLRNHCPNLRRLSITFGQLKDSTLSAKTLSDILDRLTEFKVGKNYGGEEATDRLLSILSLSHRSPPIVHLDLGWSTLNLAAMKAVLAKLPFLKLIRMPLSKDHIDLVELFSSSASLERVEGLNLLSTGPWFSFCLQWITAMSHSKIGTNVYFSPRPFLVMGIHSRLSLLQIALMDYLDPFHGLSPVEMLTRLAGAGLRQQIPLVHLFEFILKYTKRPIQIQELVEYLMSSLRPAAFLPAPPEMQFHLQSCFPLWSDILSSAPASTIGAVLKLIGPPRVETVKLFQTALHRNPFEPAVMAAFKDVAIEILLETDLDDFFVPIRSSKTLKWLLNYLGREKGPQGLAASLPDGAWSNIMRKYLKRGGVLFEELQTYFGATSDVLYSFPQPYAFESFAECCLRSADVALLRRAAECTGLDRISPSTRARVLFYCFDHENADANFLDYWTEFICREGPAPDFSKTALGQANPIILSLLSRQHVIKFYPFLLRFKEDILQQLVDKVDDLNSLMEGLVFLSRDLQEMLEDDPSFGPYFDGYKIFVEEYIRRLSFGGYCPSAVLVPHVFDPNLIASETDFVLELFDFACESDFSAENASNHAKCVKKMMKRSVENHVKHSNWKSFMSLVSLWIGYAAAESQHRNLNLARLISIFYNRCQNSRRANRFDQEIESVLDILVRCDGRPLEMIHPDAHYQ